MKKIGIFIPKSNLTVEYELLYLYNKNYFNIDDICFCISKLDFKRNYKEDKEGYLEDLANDVNNKIVDLDYLNVDYKAFFCTSSAIKYNISFENPASALIKIANKKAIKKCLLITPYNEEIGSYISKLLIDNNIDVVNEFHLNLLHTNEYFEFGIDKLEKFILDNYKEEYGDIVISCTNLPTLRTIENLKDKLNVNIISSNSSLFEIIKEVSNK